MARTKKQEKSKDKKAAKDKKVSKTVASAKKLLKKKTKASSSKETKETKAKKEKEREKESKKTKKGKRGKEVEAPNVITEGRSGKSKLPAILMRPDFINIQKEMDSIEKGLKFKRTDLFVSKHIDNAISSGILNYDFMQGGGYAIGRMVATPGPEGSGKTTSMMTSIANAVDQDVPCTVFDAEAAFDAAYADSMLRRFNHNMKELQGVYNEKRGIWEIPPMVRIYQINNGEQVFRAMRRTMRLFPDIERDRDGNYWATTTDAKGKKTTVEHDGSCQMAFFIDGFAALIPNILDEDDEKETIGAQALMFSRMLPKVASLMTRKNCLVVGSNQVRDKIGGYGGGVTHPGGNALRFYTDVRNSFNAISASTAKFGEQTKSYFEERGLYGGMDHYQFIKIVNNKHKAFTPKRECFARIRNSKDDGGGDGFCETFDCYAVMEATGQVSRRGKTLSFNVMPTKEKGGTCKLPFDPQAKKIMWNEFKALVEKPEYKHAIYKHVRAQIKSGFAFKLEIQAKQNKASSSESTEE